MSADVSKRLCLGLDNPVTVMIQSCPGESIGVEVNHGKLENTSPCRYIYKPGSLGVVKFNVLQTWRQKNAASFLFNIYDLRS